ncbi:hypothetical protein GCM10015536_55950 [Streptomyces griseomycini]|nr:hypothetical protein GCM10015536_55950 [Streptomyces griseomycini]
MISGLPSAAGTTSPGSHPTSCRLAGRPRQVARIIRAASGGFPDGGVQVGAGAGSCVRDAIVRSLPLFRTSYENRGWLDDAEGHHRVRGRVDARRGARRP